MILFVLILSYYVVLAAGGGLWIPGLMATTLLLSLTSFYYIFRAIKEKRLSHSQVLWPTLILLVSFFIFLLPLEMLPAFMLSEARLEIDDRMQAFLTLSNQSGIIQGVEYSSRYTLNYWGTTRFLITALMFVNVIYLVSILPRLKKIIYIRFLVGGACIVAACGLANEFIYSQNGKYWWVFDFGEKNTKACFGNSNHFGVFLLVFLPFCLFFIYYYWKKGVRGMACLWGGLYIFLLTGVAFSYSRGAYALALLVTIGIFFPFKGKLHNRVNFIVMAFVVTLFFAWLLPERLENEFSKGIGNSEYTRLELYENVPKMVQSFPQGTGPLAYRFTSMTYLVGPDARVRIAHHSESTFFQILQEWGIVPFLFWLGLIAGFSITVIDFYRRGRLSRRLATPAFISLVAILLHGSYDFPYAVPIYSFMVASIAGLLLSRGEKYDNSIHHSWQLGQSYLTILLPIVSIIYISAIYFKGEETLYKDRFEYGEKCTIQELTELLSYQPSSWHTWYWLGRRLLEEKQFDLAEKCFKNVTMVYPNHVVMWDYLARVRYLQGRDDKAAVAYRMYFLMLPFNKREAKVKQAKAFLQLTDKEIKELLYIKLKESELTKEFIQSI